MKYRKFNKYEKKENQAKFLEQAMGGEGLYLFENNTNADLTLPRPTNSGIRQLAPKGQPNAQFQGDNYYMQLVRAGHLRLIKELQSPAQQRALNEAANMTDKLILDQPDRVTNQGQVEQVVQPTAPQKLNESDKQPQTPVLLNEGPVDGGFVIIS